MAVLKKKTTINKQLLKKKNRFKYKKLVLTASINTEISETSDSKGSPDNIETKSSREIRQMIARLMNKLIV